MVSQGPNRLTFFLSPCYAVLDVSETRIYLVQLLYPYIIEGPGETSKNRPLECSGSASGARCVNVSRGIKQAQPWQINPINQAQAWSSTRCNGDATATIADSTQSRACRNPLPDLPHIEAIPAPAILAYPRPATMQSACLHPTAGSSRQAINSALRSTNSPALYRTFSLTVSP